MAEIDILVSTTPGGTVKIWARNNNTGRVCYGGLSGSARGLKIKDSAITARVKERKGYVRGLTIIDRPFGVVHDPDLKGIVAGISRALTETAESIPWDSVEAKFARHLWKHNVNRAHLARLINPASFGFQPSLTITSLDFLARDDDDDDPPWFVPNPHISSAVTLADANWNF
jgi:hypothetical protein